MIGAVWLPPVLPGVEVAYEFARFGSLGDYYAAHPFPADPLFALLALPGAETFQWGLRLWKVWGILALLLFLWQSRPREPRPDTLLPLMALSLVASALYPWASPLELGEPALWTLLLLSRSAHASFRQGVLWAIGISVFPLVLLGLLWVVYRRVEERRPHALGLLAGGLGWGLLASAALLKALGLLPGYWQNYWLFTLHLSLTSLPSYADIGLLLILLTAGQFYMYRPYRERLGYRDRLWTAIVSLPLPASAALWSSFLREWEGLSPLRYVGLLFLALRGYEVGQAIASRPSCTVELPAGSCILGTPPCYVRLEGRSGCALSSPFVWQEIQKHQNWLLLARLWQGPSFVWDPEGNWAEVRYYLPYFTASYQRVAPGARPPALYQRR
ncbi:MAG: hypothetical protein NZ958_07110 [Bacteroidia bacterium]|nr:hypothetical protein [Bacteroidia bacterium]MDW8089467.1 hypothetical protein [Bacteroidia bacterium]